LWGEGVVSIGKGSDCSSAPQCNKPTPPITFTLKENPTSFAKPADGKRDWCTIAQQKAKMENPNSIAPAIFSPVTKSASFHETLGISKCFNSIGNYWQFNINPIEINTIFTTCMDNIPANRKGKEIYKDTPYCDYSKSELQKILEDLKGKYGYPSKNSNGYVFVDLDLDHERVHKADYYKLLNESLPEIQNRVNGYKPKCGEKDVENNIKTQLNSKLKKVFKDVEGKWKQLNVPSYEPKTQNTLSTEIDSLIQFIKSCPNMREK
jgi:hypothetical protein